jgi:hypothetical protein
MSSFDKTYGSEGPLGFPLSSKQAKNLETLLKALPRTKEFEYRKTILLKSPSEVKAEERSDVSWISTETPDRYEHVMFAKGMNDSQYAMNPIVTLNHDYQAPPIGRSLWRKYFKDGDTKGIKAKTVYPPMPATWPTGETWIPDKVFAQIQAGLLNAKSIGWLPTKAHYADTKDVKENNWPAGALIVEEWLLVEYAVGSIGVNPETVTETVTKTVAPEPAAVIPLSETNKLVPAVVPFTTLDQLEKVLASRIAGNVKLDQIVQDVLDRKRGRV